MVSESYNKDRDDKWRTVLILVLLEDGIGGVLDAQDVTDLGQSLNPCFTGRWYRRWNHQQDIYFLKVVLILVLLEDGIGVHVSLFYH